jgi:outer membrane protein assembly factor BamB
VGGEPVTVIDLSATPAPVRPRYRLVPPRPLVLAAIGALTLAALTASARPTAQGVRPLWSAPYQQDDTLTLTPTSLYVSHHGPGAPTLDAYDLATGRSRWSAPATDVVIQVPAVSDGVIVAPDGYEKSSDRPDLVMFRTTRTIARDAQTGAALWRASGAPQGVTDDAVLLSDAGSPGTARVRKVGLHDGRVIWSRATPGLASVAVVGHSVVTATGDGRLTALRDTDGSVLGSVRVGWPDGGTLAAAAGHLVVGNGDPAAGTSTVYRPETLTALWHADGPLVDCGAVLCGADAAGLVGHDPGTGARRWRLAGMATAWPLRQDRIMATSEPPNGPFQLLDPVTGRRVGTPGTGLGTWPADGRSTVEEDAGAPGALALHATGDVPARTAVVRVDLETGDRDVIGAIDGVNRIGCRTVTGYLVCPQGSRVAVTALG